MDPADLVLRLVTTLIPLILAISVHEFAHIAMARWLGDDLGTRLGRYTLNPIAHVDPFWTLLLPAILVLQGGMGFFAAGKPAPYNPASLDRHIRGKRVTLRTAELLVAIAGPLSNVALALVTGAVVVILHYAGVDVYDRASPVRLLLDFFALNLALFAFNLIPVPPLDGSKVLFGLLPHDAARKYDEIATKLSWVLFIGAILLAGYFIYPEGCVAWDTYRAIHEHRRPPSARNRSTRHRRDRGRRAHPRG
jgi:Zn-dependent protease